MILLNSHFFSKILPVLLLLFLLLNISVGQSQNVHKLELQFTGLENDDESVVLIAVYNKSDNFLGDKPFMDFAAKTNGKADFAHIIELPKGTYAIAFFQDLNGNKILDKNFVGYPKEPFAFSNNAPANFGPPKWSDAVFKLEKSEVMKIDF